MVTKDEKVTLTIEDTLRIRLQLQQAIAELGQKALSDIPLNELCDYAVRQLRDILGVEYTKVLELLPNGKELILRAGVGWSPEIKVNVSTVDTGNNSQAGYTLKSKKPVIVDDLRKEKRFNGPPLLQNHKVISGMSVILYKGKKKPYGVLGIHTTKKRKFTQDDVDYLQSVANILSLAIQRNEIEEDLHESQQAFKALYDSNLMGVVFANLTGGIRTANDAFLDMIGYTREDLEQKRIDWSSLTPKEYKHQDIEAGKVFRKTGVVPPYEKEIFTKNGERKTVLVGGVMINKETTESAAFTIDISERKKIEQRKDEFIGIASHELRTPLTSIKGYVQILDKLIQNCGDDRAIEYLKKTNLHVDKMNRLIGDLLDVSRIQSGKLELNKEDFDIVTMVNEAIDLLQPTTSKHKIKLQAGGEIVVNADRNRIEQVVLNLLSNAIKYSPGSKEVDVEIQKIDNVVQVGIRDYGIGIPKKKQKRIFERFYRVSDTAQEFSGMGIGLYVSSEIVKRHKGKIWLESEPGKGSIFYFTIPITIRR